MSITGVKYDKLYLVKLTIDFTKEATFLETLFNGLLWNLFPGWCQPLNGIKQSYTFGDFSSSWHIIRSPTQVHGVMTYIPPPLFSFFFAICFLYTIIMVSNNHKSTISFSLYWFLYTFVPFTYQAIFTICYYINSKYSLD